MNDAPRQNGRPCSYPMPNQPTPRPIPLWRRGWFVVLSAIVLVGVLGGVLGTVLRDALPTSRPTLSGLNDIGATPSVPPVFGDPSAPPAAGALGVPARDGDLEFTVTGVECGLDRIGDETFGTEAVGQFCVVLLDLANVGTEPAAMIDFLQELHDDAGRPYSADVGASIYYTEAIPSIGPLDPGERRSTQLFYDLPVDAVPAEIELHGAPFGSPGVRVPLG